MDRAQRVLPLKATSAAAAAATTATATITAAAIAVAVAVAGTTTFITAASTDAVLPLLLHIFRGPEHTPSGRHQTRTRKHQAP